MTSNYEENWGRVLVTGASGFVGRAVCKALEQEGYAVRRAVREHSQFPSPDSWKEETGMRDFVPVGDVGPETDWAKALEGMDVVIHSAARAHVIKEKTSDPLATFRRINVGGTERLARMAAAAGVRRMVYISSIGVNGRSTQGHPFTEADVPRPYDPYTISKWEAEKALQQAGKKSKLEIAVLRPPLVYGPHAPGNFARLMRVAQISLPLPLGSVKNIRSFIYICNLVDAIITCVRHPKAAGETFLVSDGQDISTPDLIRMIAFAMGTKSFLIPFSPAALKAMGKLTGKSVEIERLMDSLQVDSSKIKKLLDWKPPYTLEEGIRETALSYRNEKRKKSAL